jgi:hypothetical protein
VTPARATSVTASAVAPCSLAVRPESCMTHAHQGSEVYASRLPCLPDPAARSVPNASSVRSPVTRERSTPPRCVGVVLWVLRHDDHCVP